MSRLKRKHLEIVLSKLRGHPSPSRLLEQYTIPADLAAKILTLAAYRYDDIVGKVVFDLGCGTGRLAIGAALLGADYVIGLDIDRIALNVAKLNAYETEVSNRVDWVLCDIAVFQGSCHTVLQNPPFGTGLRGADRVFLKKAMELGSVVYTIHKSETDGFIRRFVEDHGGSISAVFKALMTIPRIFPFHEKRVYKFEVYIYRIEVV
ncbi:50S ribosomal protein L11 methyltransferase [Candidatus Bathyarchaeota archaeon]|nr:50S ribosomal protein L11 methyltransferase [Candidatus Bathyarchaeota archaeon]